MNLNSTLLLYRNSPYLKEASATITDLILDESSNSIKLVLDQTVFYPEGGGQSADKGTINGFSVSHVSKDKGTVFHHISCPKNSFNIKDTVNLSIDWDYRFDNMQRHSGEHVLSGMFFQEVGGVNRGFAMSSDYMTLDISLEELPSAPTRRSALDGKVDKLTQEDISHIELCANKAIWNNLPSSIRYFEKGEEANNVPLRKPVSIESGVTIVSIGSEKNAADSVACSGTHVSRTGEIGLIKIIKWENYKGMYRIYAEAGERAFDYCKKEHDLVQTLCLEYSSTINDLKEKIQTREHKLSSVKEDYIGIQKELIGIYKDKIMSDIDSFTPPADNTKAFSLLTYDFSTIPPDQIFNIDKDIDIPDNLCLAITAKGSVLILISKNIDCKNLTEKAKAFGGRGGGKNNKVRISFSDTSQIENFISCIFQ